MHTCTECTTKLTHLEHRSHFPTALAEAIPMPGSGITLPLDLGLIASRCKGSYYAPKRFAVRSPWFAQGCTAAR